jgi:hypothetical protein
MFASAIGWLNWLPFRAAYLLVSFAALTALFSYLEGLSTGWVGLARKFRYRGAPYAYQWPREDARLNNRCTWYGLVKIGADKEGLYMGSSFFFRAGHAPLFIPWSEIQVVSGEHGWLFKRRKLILGRKELVQISMSVSLTEKLKSAAEASWPGDTVWRQ